MSVVKCDEQNMVRQVNLAAAFHDHISCTKLPEGICGLEHDNSVDANHVHQSSQGFTQSDHIYATEKSLHSNDSNQINISTFEITEMSDQNQIQRLKDMILVQLDLIQHQQEQLLKKDRQLQGLKQDREALCLRLEKMEKRIAVLTSKLAISFNSNTNTATSSSTNNINMNPTKTENENCINENQTQTNPINPFSDSQLFTKIYPKSSAAASSSSTPLSMGKQTPLSMGKQTPLSMGKQTQSSNVKNNSQIVKIKKETQDQSEQTSVRKIRKRQNEITSTNSNNNNNNNNNNNISISNNSCKKKCRSTGTSTTSEFIITDFVAPKIHENQTAKPLKTGKKKIAKKCHNSDVNCSNSNLNSNSSTSNKSIFNPKDFLTTEKPYSVNINCNLDDIIHSPHLKTPKICQQKLKLREIEVPSWRIHQVSSCYSLEGTEV